MKRLLAILLVFFVTVGFGFGMTACKTGGDDSGTTESSMVEYKCAKDG